MAARHAIRTHALQALFQLDARPDEDEPAVREAVLEDAGNVGLTRDEAAEAYDLALAAYEARRESDRRVAELAPTWPAVRQPAVDRAILRLAVYEMTRRVVPPKIAVNEAVKLAKSFGGEQSPKFVNGVLDKILRSLEPAPDPDPARAADGGA